MNELQRSSCACVALMLGVASAYAADMPLKAPPVPPVLSWTGFYIGGEIGERSAVVDPSVTSSTLNSPGAPVLNVLGTGVCGGAAGAFPCPGGTSLDNAAFRAGLYGGINWQLNRNWVVGLEGEFAWADATRTLGGQMYPGGSSAFAIGSSTFSIKTTWDASARARLGFLVVPNVLLYGTGGASLLHVEATSFCDNTGIFQTCAITGNFGPPIITNSATRLGWTIGAGIEANLGGHWLLRSEYRFADYGTWANTDIRSCPGPACALNIQNAIQLGAAPGSTFTTSYATRLQTHTVSIGAAYKFGDAPVAVATPAMPVKAARVEPAAAWTGFHVGGDVGTRAAVVDPSVTSATLLPAVFGIPANVNLLGTGYCAAGALPCPGPTSLGNTAFRGGAYAGYDWQFSREWVAGLEADFGWADRSRTLGGEMYPGGSPAFIFGASSFTVRTTWDASARGRLGVLLAPDVLFYGTGGASWLHVEATSACDTAVAGETCAASAAVPSGAFGPAVITNSTTRLGWTIGAGLEANIGNHWLLRAEYRFADYGTWTNTDTRTCGPAFCSFFTGAFILPPAAGSTETVAYSTRVQTHTTNLGLAYKF
jgi:outer membrane immunogenic protein